MSVNDLEEGVNRMITCHHHKVYTVLFNIVKSKVAWRFSEVYHDIERQNEQSKLIVKKSI